jgi:short-subunit dehydrogenase
MPTMLSQARHIVNFSSVFGFVTVPTQSAYHISKFGIRGFTECLSRGLEGTGVSATRVHPGGIATRIGTDAGIAANADDIERKFIDKLSTLLRRRRRSARG